MIPTRSIWIPPHRLEQCWCRPEIRVDLDGNQLHFHRRLPLRPDRRQRAFIIGGGVPA